MKVLFIDMDNVLVDFPSAFPKIDKEILEKYKDDKDEIPWIFSLMKPMSGAVESITAYINRKVPHRLIKKYPT